jgi:hypothetical protein
MPPKIRDPRVRTWQAGHIGLKHRSKGGRQSLNVTRLVTAGAAQREGFERRQLTVRPHDIVIDDLDRGSAAAI